MTAMFMIALWRLVAQWRRFNNGLNHLGRLSESQLAELGNNRSDVIRFAMEQSEKR